MTVYFLPTPILSIIEYKIPDLTVWRHIQVSVYPVRVHVQPLTRITLFIMLQNDLPAVDRGISVIKSFFGHGTDDIFNRVRSKEARRTCPEQIWRVAQRKLDQLNAVVSLESLRFPPGNRLEALKDDRKGQQSIRINEQYRICFVWTDDGPERVEITDYH